jgi:ABC-type multidrug transport system fused ATPase/permease subunit
MGLIKQITSYFIVYKKYIGNRFYIVFFLSLVATLTEGVGIMMLLPLIDVAGINGSNQVEHQAEIASILRNFLIYLGLETSFVGILILIIFIFLIKGVVHFASLGYQVYLRTQLMLEIKTNLFQKYSSIDYSYYLKHNTGHYVNIINRQSGEMIVSFENFKQFIVSILTSSAYLICAFFITWKFALMALVSGGMLLFVFRGMNHRVHMLSRKTASEFSTLNKLLVQMMQSFKYLLATGQHEHLRNGFLQSVEKVSHYVRKQGVLQSFTVALTEPVAIILVISVIIIQVAVLQEPLAPIFVALILFNRAMGSVMGIQQAWQLTLDKIGGLEVVEREFSQIEACQEVDGTVSLTNLRNSIELRDVVFAYSPTGQKVLDGVSLSIRANTSVAFVGQSGAGKTTLADLLTIILRPQEGLLLLDGVDSRVLNLKCWREQIGYVSQETVVFDDSIANNICLWLGDIHSDPLLRDRVEWAAKQAYADSFIEQLPNGYDTLVGDRGVRLSGGQRQRLFLARELFRCPKLFILDEATSALDSESEQFIKNSIDALKGAATIVIIAHRLSTIRDVDYLYILDQGKIVEHGTYRDLMSQEGSQFQKMIDLQRI